MSGQSNRLLCLEGDVLDLLRTFMGYVFPVYLISMSESSMVTTAHVLLFVAQILSLFHFLYCSLFIALESIPTIVYCQLRLLVLTGTIRNSPYAFFFL